MLKYEYQWTDLWSTSQIIKERVAYMDKRKVTLMAIISVLCFSACTTKRPSSSSASQISSDTTSSDSSSGSSSEIDPPTPITKTISLYSPNSKFYINSLSKDNVATLKTYHHKDFNDVPFVDFEEFHYAVRPYIERARSFSQVDDDHYVYSTIDNKGTLLFDTKNDTLKYTNLNRFLDVLGVNNGIYGCPSQNTISRYTGSEKTKFIKNPSDLTINLKDYGFDLVSQDNRLYVSIGVISSTIFPTFISGISYNGKDFFVDPMLRNSDLSVYARSGNYNFSWPLASSECPTAFKKVANKLDNEAYRFEGIFGDREEREDLVTMSLFKNGTGTLNGSGGAIVHKAMNWKLDGDVIKMVVAQVPYESSDIEDTLGDLTEAWINTSETNYGKRMRSNEMTQENYRDLCLTFDLSYGLKKTRNITSFDSFFKENNLKDRLLNNDIMIYEDAFAEFICKHIDDIHSSINGGESVYSPSETRAYLRNKASSYAGPRYTSYYQEIKDLGTLRAATTYTDSYVIEGETACLRFQIFAHSSASCFPITHKDYQTNTHEEAVAAYQNAVGNNPYKAFAIAFNDLKKLDNIKNVVIDVTGNIGGELRCAPYLAAFMTLDPSIVMEHTMDGSIVDYHFKADLNGDGKYGESGDSFEGKYNFYLLDGANFSAGNEFATMAKNIGFAKLLGRKSAGGSCAIANRTDISGLTYRMSSMYQLMLKTENGYISNDGGLEPDLTIPFDNMFDLKKMDAWFKTLG